MHSHYFKKASKNYLQRIFFKACLGCAEYLSTKTWSPWNRKANANRNRGGIKTEAPNAAEQMPACALKRSGFMLLRWAGTLSSLQRITVAGILKYFTRPPNIRVCLTGAAKWKFKCIFPLQCGVFPCETVFFRGGGRGFWLYSSKFDCHVKNTQAKTNTESAVDANLQSIVKDNSRATPLAHSLEKAEMEERARVRPYLFKDVHAAENSKKQRPKFVVPPASILMCYKW